MNLIEHGAPHQRQPFLPAALRRGAQLAGAAWLALHIGPAWAVDPNDCVDLRTDAHGKMELHNRCTQAISLSWCVDNPASTFSCSPRRIASGNLRPGAKTMVTYYQGESAGRQVHWAACVQPQVVLGWRGPGSRFECR